MNMLSALIFGISLLVGAADSPEVTQPPTDVEVHTGERAVFTCGVRADDEAWTINGTHLAQLPLEVRDDNITFHLNTTTNLYVLEIPGRPQYNNTEVRCVAIRGSERVFSEPARLYVTGNGDTVSDPTDDPTGDPTGDPADDPTSDPTGNPADDPTGDPTGNSPDKPTGHPTGDSSDSDVSNRTVIAIIMGVVVVGIWVVSQCVSLWQIKNNQKSRAQPPEVLPPDSSGTLAQTTRSPPPQENGAPRSTNNSAFGQASSTNPHSNSGVRPPQDTDVSSAQLVRERFRRSSAPSGLPKRSGDGANTEMKDVIPPPSKVLPMACSAPTSPVLRSFPKLTAEDDREDELPDDDQYPLAKEGDAVSSDGAGGSIVVSPRQLPEQGEKTEIIVSSTL